MAVDSSGRGYAPPTGPGTVPWMRVTVAPPRHAPPVDNVKHPGLYKTLPSTDAPTFFHIPQVVAAQKTSRAPWDYITRKPKGGSQRGDTQRDGKQAVSKDTPSWFTLQSLKAPRAAPEPYTKVVMDNLVLLRGVPPATAVLPATTLRVGRPQAARHPTPTRQLPAKLPPRRRRHSSMDGDGSLPSRRSRNSTMGSVAKAKPSPTPASPRPPSHPRRRHSSAASAATSPASSRRSSYSRPRRTNASTPRSQASSAGRALLAAAMGEPQRPPPSASGGGAPLSPRRHRMSLRAHEKMLAAAEAGTGTGAGAASGGEGAGMVDEGVESPRRDQAPWSPRRPAGGWHTDRTTRGARRRQPVPTRAALGPSAPLLTITPRSPRLVFGRMDRFPRQHAAAVQQPLF